MDLRDILVASVAIVLGAIMLHSALVNQGWCFQMRFAQSLESLCGRNGARAFIGGVGSIMVMIGVHLLLPPSLLASWFSTTQGIERKQPSSFEFDQPNAIWHGNPDSATP